MGKIVFWIVVFFVVLLAVRLVNVAAARARRDAGRPSDEAKRDKLAAEPTVRCARCGVYLPKSEALPAPDGYRCGDPACTRQR